MKASVCKELGTNRTQMVNSPSNIAIHGQLTGIFLRSSLGVQLPGLPGNALFWVETSSREHHECDARHQNFKDMKITIDIHIVNIYIYMS